MKPSPVGGAYRGRSLGIHEGLPPRLRDKLDPRLKGRSLTRGDCVRMQMESIKLRFPEYSLKPFTSGWAGKV